MREIGSRNDDGIHVFERQQIFEIRECSRRTAVDGCSFGGGAVAIDFPKIADGGHFDVVPVFELGDDSGEFGSARADADVAEGNAFVGALDAAIGEGGGSQRGTAGEEGATM